MRRNHHPVSESGAILLLMVLANAIILESGLVHSGKWYGMLLLSLPLFLLFVRGFQKNK